MRKNKERLLWAWKHKGCRAPDPHSLSYSKDGVTRIYGRPPGQYNPTPGEAVRVALRIVSK